MSGLSMNVLILHAGAIGDVIIGTATAAAIKANSPNASITYWTHESLFDLLRLCPAIDHLVAWDKRKPLLHQLQVVRESRADVIVDMTASLRTRILGLVSGRTIYRYAKQSARKRPIVHAAENFLSTVEPLIGRQTPTFPTLIVPPLEAQAVCDKFGLQSASIALVPGVGRLRPHRAWSVESWIKLASQLTAAGRSVILIGGPEDRETATKISQAVAGVTNLCGELSLAETAAALSGCVAAITGDTGPSHIAVAVGTPVLGLLGPTYPERSGPYGYLNFALNACQQCHCQELKQCKFRPGSGACMDSISVDTVCDTIERLTTGARSNVLL